MREEAEKVVSQLLLVIDDEIQIRRLLRLSLEGAGYKVIEAATGREGLVEAATRRPDAVLLDLGLPELDGMAVLKGLREWSAIPVIVLTVRDEDEEKVKALDAGADDYVTKPFSTPELLARLRATLRRTAPEREEPIVKTGDLEVDLSRRVVRKAGREVKLTATEYALLRLFASHPGRVLTHTHLMKDVWGPNAVHQTHYLRVYMKHLREKLETEPEKPRLLVTEPGVGYRLHVEEPGD